MLGYGSHRETMIKRAVHHLYVHVPFCARRCSYCDFAISVRDDTPVESYIDALKLELNRLDTSGWALETIYLGGGTPSRLGESVGDVLRLVRDRAKITDNAEITIEANPDDVTRSAAESWARDGVNRVSLGSQSFEPEVLKWMHRTHTANQIGASFATLRQAGIQNLSLDLIFALPESLHRDWSADVDRVLELQPEHVSLYGLTVEPHTPLSRWLDRGDVIEAPEERYESDFMLAHQRLEQSGFEHYEVSNFGLPDRRSRHNSSYWTGASYAGIGPSAHSFDGAVRSWNVAAYTDWERRLRAGKVIVAESETLTEENRLSERVYLGLRTIDGLPASDAEIQLARPWQDAGWAEIKNGTIVLTAMGFLRLDALAASLTLAGSR